ncbi:Septal ring factor EnvC, activator of murein hydrolases AmiA and AmiB [Pustulibacterium marinum]|uniref:Septal ring factor EnvC, activator of murein hydrolases AmiA and AmiB n=1 Tax=Pustulibacterium marinum TaxID=1224947 RepID=A0A1I7EU48_9FLAO|nr:peptidoglycan DD-metalloendopeptidase family protein [Pustulibacterium marinum]SFU27433.1 Septal ring factor EnvC, activator of murein hydrolases AmiA and AmiB [Pustulibacterium marinum]
MTRTLQTYICSIAFIFLAIGSGFSQSKEQKALEQKRSDLMKEINQIQQLLQEQGKERKSLATEIEGLNKKISVRQELIKVTNQQANLLSREINNNQRNIEKLRSELQVLKEDYAKMIRKSYRNKSKQNRLMFLLSSESFFQAYKRMEYMSQYRDHRKKQGLAIQSKTEELKQLNQSLIQQRKDKEVLIAENRKAQNSLEVERKQQQELIASVKKKESGYLAQIKTKQQEADRLEKEIQRLIREAIAESRRKAEAEARKSGKTVEKTASNQFALTPEDKMIANNFAANKGRLIWPVERGVVSQGYGEYSDPVYPGVKHLNNGVNIVTNEGADARAVFEGEVMNIMVINNKATIYIRHGNFITTYSNLSKSYVRKGDKVAAKQALGQVFTSRTTGKTEMKFLIYKNTIKLNPELWIAKM